MLFYKVLITVFAYIGAVIFGIGSLILGILALVPSAPFNEQNITLGIILIVLSVTGITELTGAIIGALIGIILCIPIIFCLED